MSRERYIWLCIIVLDLVLVFLNQSTFDNGDSILHYLQAHQAFSTPSYFLDMWSKPIFMALASPFAYWGWWGIKVFNSICMLLSAYLTKRIFEYYHANGWWGVLLCFFAHGFFLVQSSGLTEPLFTLALTAIVLLLLHDRITLAIIAASFLPYVRSEGYVIGCILIVYLLYARQYKYIIWLIVGTVFYGVIGLFVFQDFLWMFTQNPYVGSEIKYGSGPLDHFINQLPYVIGLPICILFYLGVIRGGMLFLKGQMQLKELFLIYGICIGYIVAHSVFWRFGLFHSFGMTRVLVVVIPLIAFIAYRGVEWLQCAFYFIPKKYVAIVLASSIIIFPFTNNKMGAKLPKNTKISTSQVNMTEASNWLKANNLSERTIHTSYFYLAILLDKNINSDTDISHLKKIMKNRPKPGSIIVWDSYFAVTEAEVPLKFIETMLNVKLLKIFTTSAEQYPHEEIRIYEVLE